MINKFSKMADEPALETNCPRSEFDKAKKNVLAWSKRGSACRASITVVTTAPLPNSATQYGYDEPLKNSLRSCDAFTSDATRIVKGVG